jgi:hypothetical protein
VALIGDPILEMRQVLSDMPGVLGTPSHTAAVVTATGSTLAAATYVIMVTQRNAWGETLTSTETTGTVIGANQGIQITSALLPGATTIRAYLGTGSAGSENQFVESTTSPFTISTPPTNAGSVPTRNTAYNPDLDGSFLSAGAVFQWLNKGVELLSQLTGGIRDYTGVGTSNQQALYVLNGNWKEISDIWYNGYWFGGGARKYYFKRSAVVSGILTTATISVRDNRTVLELYPQPDRNAGTTTTTASMGTGDSSIAIASAGVLLMPFGFVQIDSEIMAYSNNASNTLTGLIRGIGGTVAATHASGATVTELNLAINGLRLGGSSYAPGNANLTMPFPQGWSGLLSKYLTARAYEVEKDGQSAKRLMDEFKQESQQYRSNNSIFGQRQVGPPSLPDAITFGIPGGGWLVR